MLLPTRPNTGGGGEPQAMLLSSHFLHSCGSCLWARHWGTWTGVQPRREARVGSFQGNFWLESVFLTLLHVLITGDSGGGLLALSTSPPLENLCDSGHCSPQARVTQ